MTTGGNHSLVSASVLEQKLRMGRTFSSQVVIPITTVRLMARLTLGSADLDDVTKSLSGRVMVSRDSGMTWEEWWAFEWRGPSPPAATDEASRNASARQPAVWGPAPPAGALVRVEVDTPSPLTFGADIETS